MVVPRFPSSALIHVDSCSISRRLRSIPLNEPGAPLAALAAAQAALGGV